MCIRDRRYISDDYEANLEEAKQLMADAGYPNGEGFPTIEYSANDAGYPPAPASSPSGRKPG